MKFYMIKKESIKLQDYHINVSIIPFVWLINLTENELHKIPVWQHQLKNFKYWDVDEIDWYEFLKPKHALFTYNSRIDSYFGLNVFNLNEYDLMYMKLMGWIQ